MIFNAVATVLYITAFVTCAAAVQPTSWRQWDYNRRAAASVSSGGQARATGLARLLRSRAGCAPLPVLCRSHNDCLWGEHLLQLPRLERVRQQCGHQPSDWPLVRSGQQSPATGHPGSAHARLSGPELRVPRGLILGPACTGSDGQNRVAWTLLCGLWWCFQLMYPQQKPTGGVTDSLTRRTRTHWKLKLLLILGVHPDPHRNSSAEGAQPIWHTAILKLTKPSPGLCVSSFVATV